MNTRPEALTAPNAETAAILYTMLAMVEHDRRLCAEGPHDVRLLRQAVDQLVVPRPEQPDLKVPLQRLIQALRTSYVSWTGERVQAKPEMLRVICVIAHQHGLGTNLFALDIECGPMPWELWLEQMGRAAYRAMRALFPRTPRTEDTP